MELRITRVFHPIGQGAFYSERHFGPTNENFNIVYDCGSLTAKGRKLENKIKGSMPSGTVIDILFLSHFDEDHVSGVRFLKEHFEVKTVIIPLMEEEAKIYARVSRYLDSGNTDNIIVDDPQAFFGDNTKVIFVLPTDFPAGEAIRTPDNDFKPGEENLGPSRVESLRDGKQIASGTKISGLKTKADWCFIPYNYKQPERSAMFHSLLTKHGIDPVDLADVKNIIKHKKLLNLLYKTVQGSININSMAVYSGPLSSHKKGHTFLVTVCGFLRYREFRRIAGGGCLYLGDIDLNVPVLITDIWSRIGALKSNLSTLQIPHHGAIASYNKLILHCNLEHIVISYGTTNSWGHPADQVLIDCLNHCGLSLITEDSNSIAVENIEFG